MSSSSALGRAFFLLLFAMPAFAQPRAPLSAFAAVQPGLWELRAEGEPVRNLCLADAEALTQLRHRAGSCSRLVIADGKGAATIHYTCPGAGWGRTSVRVETPRLLRIDSQGIADNAPFAFVAEARRLGDCGTRIAPAASAAPKPRR